MPASSLGRVMMCKFSFLIASKNSCLAKKIRVAFRLMTIHWDSFLKGFVCS